MLDGWAAKLQEPVTFHDTVLGTFTLDRRASRYTAAVRWRGQPIELHLATVSPDQLQGALATAHALWTQQESWSERVQEFAARKLLDIKNESWADEDEDGDDVVVSSTEFKGRVALESIIVRGDGPVEFWHADGDPSSDTRSRCEPIFTEGPSTPTSSGDSRATPIPRSGSTPR